MELGIQPDNELPDYVMVLVANKKTQKQMDVDLQLFLGSRTFIFTTWLHNVLRRLEQVTVSSKGVKKKTDDKKSKTKRRVSSDEEEDEKKSVKKTKHQPKVESLSEKGTSVEQSSASAGEMKKEPHSVSDDENDYLNLRADTDPEELGESIDHFKDNDTAITHDVNLTVVDSSVDHFVSKGEEETLPQSKEVSEEQPVKNNKSAERQKERVKITWDCDTKSNECKTEKLNESLEDSNSHSSSKSQEKQRSGRRRSNDREPTVPSVAVLKSAVRDLKGNQNSLAKPVRLTRDPEKAVAPIDKIKKYINSDQEKKSVIHDARDIIKRKSSGKKKTPERDLERPVKEVGEPVEKRKQLPSVSKLVVHERSADKPPDVTLPSLVKVTSRPIRRAGIQANHKLILRAVADAEKSVATAKNTQILKSPDRNNQSKRKSLLGYIPPAKISITLPNDRVPSTKGSSNVNDSPKDADFEGAQKKEIKQMEINREESTSESDVKKDEEELSRKADFEPEFLITLSDDLATDLYGLDGELDWGDDTQPGDDNQRLGEGRRVLADPPATSSESLDQRLVYSKPPFNRSRLGPPPAVAAVRPIQKMVDRIGEIDGITVDVDTTTANKVVQLKVMKRCKFWPNCAAADK
ncbi:hypothetical protein AAG570_008514 [Ranatra chinensis]|uniref:Zinc finger CCCH domain-containing protein 14 n=1 Tax=Ranatra chinensis TaxID=642074 RepID=A0ABD0YR41_9HEMI